MRILCLYKLSSKVMSGCSYALLKCLLYQPSIISSHLSIWPSKAVTLTVRNQIGMKMKTSNLTNNLPIIDRCLLLTYIHTYSYIWISKNFDISHLYAIMKCFPPIYVNQHLLNYLSVRKKNTLIDHILRGRVPFIYTMRHIQHSSIQYEQHITQSCPLCTVFFS